MLVATVDKYLGEVSWSLALFCRFSDVPAIADTLEVMYTLIEDDVPVQCWPFKTIP